MGALLCMTNSRRNGAGCETVGDPFGSILPRFNLIKIVNDHMEILSIFMSKRENEKQQQNMYVSNNFRAARIATYH